MDTRYAWSYAQPRTNARPRVSLYGMRPNEGQNVVPGFGDGDATPITEGGVSTKEVMGGGLMGQGRRYQGLLEGLRKVHGDDLRRHPLERATADGEWIDSVSNH